MTETLKLLPCPFCGGEAHLSADTSHSTAFFVSCETEDCFGLMMWAERKDAAIAAWNTRADLARAQAVAIKSDPRVKALVEQVRVLLAAADGESYAAYNAALEATDAALRAIGGE